ncbi:MAG TPA: helix-turn-helix transcriptional regulator [Flavobacterium sp.]|nr:helix-turn-helix transcriptional regulator [Flavobacterium sp.]
MKNLLRNAREAKGFKTRELAQMSGIDQALISKFESGTRTPTKAQVKKLSELLDIDFEPFMLLWLKEKILYEIKDEALGLKALKAAEAELTQTPFPSEETELPQQFQKLLDEMNSLKSMLSAKK